MGVMRSTFAGALASLAVLSSSAGAADDDAVQRLLDKAEIEATLTRYTHALDALDADEYASVFAEDAVFELGDGQTRTGRAEIRSIIEEREGESLPASTLMHHVMTNATLEFINDREARHYAYWMTIVGDLSNGFTVPAMGHYEDVLVKRSGQWLIQTRKLVLPPQP